MNKKVLTKIISFIREEMMTANAPGTQGGFGSNPPKPGVDGFDPTLKGKPQKRKRPQILAKGKLPGLRKRWSGK